MPNITFSVDAAALASAKAYAAERSVTLNKLVEAYMRSLASQQPRRAVSKTEAVLLDFSLGKVSLVDAAASLKVKDAGHVLELLRRTGLPFPQLPDDIVRRQIRENLEFFKTAAAIKPARTRRKSSKR